MMKSNKQSFDQEATTLHSDDVQDIVTTMPIGISYVIGGFVALILILIIVLSWVVKYPELISGKAVITTQNASVKLMMPSTGILNLQIKQGTKVKSNSILGILENSSVGKDVLYLKQILSGISLEEASLDNKIIELPDNLSLGELESFYYNFKNIYSAHSLFLSNNAYKQQIDATIKLIDEYRHLMEQKRTLFKINNKNVEIAHRAFGRDSILFDRKVISQAEYESSEAALLKVSEVYERVKTEILDAQIQISSLEKNLGQLKVEYLDKMNSSKNELLSAYNELIGQLYIWERKFVLKSPVDGTVEFLDFIKNNQFLQAGSPVFNILPTSTPIRAEAYIPSNGAGKIKEGQDVLLKLDDYPYDEYGFIKGKVEKVSLSTTLLPEEGNMTLITILLDEFKTNYGSSLQFKAGMTGLAEIITEDRRLIQRMFDRINRLTRKRG